MYNHKKPRRGNSNPHLKTSPNACSKSTELCTSLWVKTSSSK